MALATILARADRTTAPAALLAYERLRRERVAEVQRGARENGMRYDSAYSDLGVRDAEIAAHAAFRKRLYDHDVVPDAQAAAAALGSGVTRLAWHFPPGRQAPSQHPLSLAI